jgi:hypothetical protein
MSSLRSQIPPPTLFSVVGVEVIKEYLVIKGSK